MFLFHSDYHENWTQLEPLYSVISNVCTVHGEGNPDDVYEVAERQLFETLEKVLLSFLLLCCVDF